MKKTLLSAVVIPAILFSTINTSHAALQVIGTAAYNGSDYKLIYDTDDQMTWLDYSRPGTDYYSGSVAWAASLNNPGVLTINLDPGYTALWGNSQWQLPQMDGYQIPSGNIYYFTESTIYDLYYNELGNIENDPSINTGPFENIVYAPANASWYWLEPTFDTGPTYKPAFNFGIGNIRLGAPGMTVSVNGGIYAMATIPGAVVPEPATLALLALGGLAMLRKRK